MSNVKQITQAEFESVVLNSPNPVVVDFFADWCPPCRMLSPMLDKLAAEFAGRIDFVKINSDHERGLSAEYKVTALPTVILFENGSVAGQFAGLPNEENFRSQLQAWLESNSAV